MAVKIFFCYAHEDELLLNELRKHLRPLQRQGLIDVWYDRDISAGTEWEHEIDNYLSAADIILLLVSPDFIDSDYCYSLEMKKALEQHERKEARVIPIILRPVYWQGGPLNKLQALPADAKPVTDPTWQNIDQALYNIAESIIKVVGEMILKASLHLSAQPLQLLKQELTDASMDIPQRELASSQSLFVGEKQVVNVSLDTSHYVPNHVFISYVREDYETVQQLYKALRAYDIEVWLDRDELKPGYRWADAIREAISEGAFYIACFSTAYNNRPKTYMNEELTLAIEELRQRPTHKAWFIPVLLDKCDVPDRNIGAGETLRSLQWVNLHENWNKGIKQILSVIQPNSARVHDLIQMLGDKSARVRIKAADDLGLLGGLADLAIPALIRVLDDENETACAAAANALGSIGKATDLVIERLTANIQRKNSGYANNHAVKALVMLDRPGIIALIRIAGANSDNYQFDIIRQHVLGALSNLGKPVVVLLLELLSTKSVNDATIFSILSHVHDPNAIPKLTEALHHENLWVRNAAAEALADMRKHYLDESNAPNPLFLEVLLVLTESVRSSDHRVCSIAISTLGEIGKLASISVPTLIEAMNDSKRSFESIKALGKVGSGKTLALKALISSLNDIDVEVRVQVVLALVNIGKPIDVITPALIKASRDPNAKVRMQVVIGLAQIGEPRDVVVPVLIKALEDPDTDLRKYVVVTLRKIGYNLIKRGGRTENDAQFAKPQPLDEVVPRTSELIDVIVLALIKVLGDLDAKVREHAVVALDNIGKPIDIIAPALAKALEDPDASVRDYSVIALGRIGKPMGIIASALAKALEDPDASVRKHAAIALHKRG